MKKYNDAINICLQAIGEQTLDNDLPIYGIYEAEQADLVIENIKQELQARGWAFNTDTNWTFIPDTDGYIVIPETVLTLDPTSTTSSIILKDGKLYDKSTQSYKFTNGVACDVVWDIDFDDMPRVVQQYVTLKAARVVAQRLTGDDASIQYLMRDEQEALINLYAYEDETQDNNIFDDQSVSRALSRTSNPVGIRG